MDIALGVSVDDDAVLGELLLDEDDLLLPLDHEIAARVHWALACTREEWRGGDGCGHARAVSA